MWDWIKARLSEPSTWYGLGVVIAGVGSHFAPNEWTSVLQGIQYVLGGGAVITPDRSKASVF